MGLNELDKAAGRNRHWYVALAIAMAAVLLQLGGDASRELLAYDREALGSGELWRLVSGHFVHLGWSHLFLNLAGLSLVTWLVGYAFDVLRWVFITALSIAAIDTGLWFLDGQLDWYVGLSGLLHGVLAAGLLVGLARRDREAVILAVFVLAKLGWEQFVGPLPGSESTSGGAVIVNAHLYGAAGGALGALLCGRSARRAASI
jgi:rhomboid family GlyGly-CTERM serine protease